MRIISKFKDYYDGGSKYGIDKERVYVRETIEDTFENINLYGFEIVGFCGKIYPIINFSYRGYGNDWTRNPKEFILYEEEAIDYHFFQKKDKITYDTIYEKEKAKRERYLGLTGRFEILNSRKEYYNYLANHKMFLDIFLEKQVPIFHIFNSTRSETNITYNPVLKDLAFYKVFDTNQAYQELSMYISNILVSDTEVDVPVGSDDDIRNSKGFDKWTFRKQKQ